MLLSRDAIFRENSFGYCEHDDEKGIKEQQLLAERQKAGNVIHFSSKVTETANEEAHELPIEDNSTENNQPENIPHRSQREIAAPDRLGVIVGDWWNFASVAI